MPLCNLGRKMLDNHLVNGKMRFFQDAFDVVAVSEKHESEIVIGYSQKIEFIGARGKIAHRFKAAFVHGERHYRAMLVERINRGAVTADAQILNGHYLFKRLYFVGIAARNHRKSPAVLYKLLNGGNVCGRNTRKTVVAVMIHVLIACQRKIVIAAQ